MVTAYRSLVPVVDERVAQFHARQAHDRDAIDVARRVLATRVGLTLGGGTAIAFGIVMGPAAFAPSGLTFLAPGIWIAAIGTALVVRRYVLWRTACESRDELALTGDPHGVLGEREAAPRRARPSGRLTEMPAAA